MTDIKIQGDKYGSLFAFGANDFYPLFQFEYRENENLGGPAWYFWLRGNYDPNIFKVEKKDFPMEFFKDACRAKMFIRDGGKMCDDVNIVSGSHLLM